MPDEDGVDAPEIGTVARLPRVAGGEDREPHLSPPALSREGANGHRALLLNRQGPDELIESGAQVVDYVAYQDREGQRWQRLDSVEADIELSRIRVRLEFKGVGMDPLPKEVLGDPLQFAEMYLRPVELLPWPTGVQQHAE